MRTTTLGTLDGSVGVTPGVAGAVVGALAVVAVEPGVLLGLLELLGPPHAATMSATSMTIVIETVYLKDFMSYVLLTFFSILPNYQYSKRSGPSSRIRVVPTA